MFDDAALISHIKNNHTLKLRSVVLAEFNLNQMNNVRIVGNYRYRPFMTEPNHTAISVDTFADNIEAQIQSTDYRSLINVFDIEDIGDYYTDATKSSVYMNVGYDNDEAIMVTAVNNKMNMYFDLEQCVQPFRPRSGINKLFLNAERHQFIDRIRSAERPRYYFCSKEDPFKYWSSYRTEAGNIYGLSGAVQSDAGYQIQDAAPFVVYEELIPTNKITVKVQTNVGSYRIAATDQLFGSDNATVPVRWKVQYLKHDNTWETAYSFTENSFYDDGSPIFNWDGSVELKYGFAIPTEFKNNFNFVDYISSADLLPPLTGLGYAGEAYGVVSGNEAGQLYIRSETNEWKIYPIEYRFSLLDSFDYGERSSLKKITQPSWFNNGVSERIYREFVYLKGLRIVVETMNTPSTPFQLIEMSPRLVVDMTDYATDFSFNKTMLAGDGLPVGDIFASNGTVTLQNYDMEFSTLNPYNGETGSIVAGLLKSNVKFIFFEGIRGVGIYEKLIPIKWLYAEDFPAVTHRADVVQVNLRDLYFLLEGHKAPELFFRDIPLTAAICVLMDSIGFSNYRFIGFENDPIIPNFFVGPDQNVAEVLRKIAIATQSAIFFDEYNNLTVYSKEYIFDNRAKSYDINVNVDTHYEDGLWIDADGDNIGIANVENFGAETVDIINDGSVNFTARYIQRSVTKVAQASLVDENRVYGYKPVLLWEAAPTDSEKTINQSVASQEGFVLGAVALNSGLSQSVPEVVGGKIINNILDFGSNVYWLPRHQGYLYSNGEIIKYDAIEYIISGQATPVWIKNNREYQRYFANLPFNGLIYPTGNVRIFAEPFYETIGDVVTPKLGAVRMHGRGQFGTPILLHTAGIAEEWISEQNLTGVITDSSTIFTVAKTTQTNTYKPVTTLTKAPAETDPRTGVVGPQVSYAEPIVSTGTLDRSQIALRSKRSDIIKNFMSTKIFSEANSIEVGANGIQKSQSVYGRPPVNGSALRASALVFTGPQQFDSLQPKNFITYVKKSLVSAEQPGIYTNFGTRMRIIGEISNSNQNIQVPLGSMQYFSVVPENTDESTVISGGSGGIGILLDDDAGYFLEVMSLTNDVTKEFLDFSGASEEFKLENVVLWKKSKSNDAVTKLWGGITNILIDTGTFVGQDRAIKDNTPTVYDVSLEYIDRQGSRFFNVYINNKLVAHEIRDDSPLIVTPNMGLFVRGSSKCMFENVFAVGHNVQNALQYNDKTIGQYTRSDLNPESLSDVFRKFSLNQFISDTYLKGLNAKNLPQYILFYDEFGTIMRECFYFKIKFDNAYPALYAKIAPTFNKERRYSVAGFRATPYGAEFLVFNNTDRALVLDETTGSFLRVSGISFTQSTSYQYSVDEYFKKVSNFMDETTVDRNIYSSNPEKIEVSFRDIKASRSKYGIKGFALESDYIQTWSQAEDIMGWIIEKKFEQKQSFSIDAFGVPHLQLGDIVSIRYQVDGKDMIDKTKNFVISSIDHNRTSNGMSTKLRVVEQ